MASENSVTRSRIKQSRRHSRKRVLGGSFSQVAKKKKNAIISSSRSSVVPLNPILCQVATPRQSIIPKTVDKKFGLHARRIRHTGVCYLCEEVRRYLLLACYLLREPHWGAQGGRSAGAGAEMADL